MNQTPQPRRVRRERQVETARVDTTKLDLPPLLRFLSNPKLFIVVGILMLGGILFSLVAGNFGNTSNSNGNSVVQQMNELPDAPAADDASVKATPVPVTSPIAKRYTAAPDPIIDPTKKYTATITTGKGTIQMELYPQQAPETVNAFVFLARDGYYDGTPFMQLATNPDGSRFTVQTGDPTGTGYGTPGFSIRKEQTTEAFDKGAVGMGGSSTTSNGGQFFISAGDYPALNGKYTIFGQVTSGLDVIDKLSLVDPAKNTSAGDAIQSITISEN